MNWLRVGYIAIGMEQFPASDEEQMDYICPVIDESDYYIVLLRGKYGKPQKDGLSFTHKEFDYAASKGIPTLAFIYQDYDQLPASQIEQDPKLLSKFQDFKQSLMSNKIVRFWKDQQELATAVKDSLMHIVRRKPSVGWVRGDNAIDPRVYGQLDELRQENAKLKEQIKEIRAQAEAHSELSSGTDSVSFEYSVYDKNAGEDATEIRRDSIYSTWDKMIRFMQELIYQEPTESEITSQFESYLRRSRSILESENVKVEKGYAKKMRFQLEALGLIETFMRTSDPRHLS